MKVGDKVISKYGVIGTVIDFEPNFGYYIFWENGTSAYYV